LFGEGAQLVLAGAGASPRERALPEVVVHASSGGSDERTLLLATQRSPAPETAQQRLLTLGRSLTPFLHAGDPHTSLLLVAGGTPPSDQTWPEALDPSFANQVTDLDGLDAQLALRRLV
jgi:hypothetical protein